MSQRITQKEIIISRLRELGYCDNFWAIEHKVSLRLAAIIEILRKAGWEIEGKFGDGAHRKNFYYYLVAEPSGAKNIQSGCCFSFKKFGTHAGDCPAVAKPKEEIKQRGMLL